MYILQYNQNESKPGEAKASDPELRNIFPTLTCVTRAASCGGTAASSTLSSPRKSVSQFVWFTQQHREHSHPQHFENIQILRKK